MDGMIIRYLCGLIMFSLQKEWVIERLEVVFDGSNQPLVSDHYGLSADLYLP